ncbi:MAG: hypothetical protein IIX31_07725, partial [Alistipes sp.]|nr:hypothetical protein [Alistipes sp.]
FLAAVVYGCSIAFLTILVMGAGTVITGLTLKDRTTTFCGGAAMIVSLIFPAIYFLTTKEIVATATAKSIMEFWVWGEKIVFAAIFLFMMVVPGHILNNKYNSKNDGVCSKS